jgi:hypothetical protein
MGKRPLSRALTTLALLAALVGAGCGGKNAGGPDAKTSNDAKIDDDPVALLPSAAMAIVNLDARALYSSQSFGAQLARVTERLAPIGEEAGFVPSRDLDRVVLGMYSMQGADVAAVLVGKFDEQKIAQAAQNHVQLKGGGMIVASPYGGRTVYTVNNVGFTVISARTVVAGTQSGIRRAIDRIHDNLVKRDQPAWMLAAIDTQDAAFSGAADFATQPVGAASLGIFPIPWVQGMKAVRLVGNFHDPGLNVAGTVTYGDPQRAGAAAGELRATFNALSVLSMAGVPQPKNLKIEPVQSDAQVSFAVDDQQLRALLQMAQQYLPQQ